MKLKMRLKAFFWFGKPLSIKPEMIATFRKFLLNNEELISIGEAAQNFVRSKWNPNEVAKRYIKLIDDDIPNSWWVNPYEIFYFEGIGQPRSVSVQNVKNLIKNYGKSSLQLTHNPKLERAFVEFSESKYN